ncbi:MAG: flagellar biosynthetic protein FliR [Caulobacteraceae bacterium]
MGPFATADQIWIAGLVFLRIGAIVMLLPGVGEAYVPPRVRLAFALVLAMVIAPIAAPALAAMPPTVGGMMGIALRELIIGLLIGGLLRTLMASLAVAGEIVSLQTTLGFAQVAAPGQAQPTAAISGFLGLLGVTLLFSSGLHRAFIGAMAHSYTVFAPAKHVLVSDAAQLMIRTFSSMFSLGVQLAAPVIVFSLVFNIASGMIGRVMPQFQIFFVAAPLNILMGLSIFALGLGVLGLVWLDRYRLFLTVFT